MTIEELSDIIHSPEQLCPPYIFQQTTKDNQRLPFQAQSCDQSITFHIKSSNHQITNAHQLPSLVPHPSLQITPLPPGGANSNIAAKLFPCDRTYTSGSMPFSLQRLAP